jgi:hypothetical protein
MAWTLLGLACVIYATTELASSWRSARSAPPSFCFGAVDEDTGRRLRVTLDRRTRGRRSADR